MENETKPAAPRRVIHRFEVPKACRGEGDAPTSIGLYELTAREELGAAKQAKNDPVRLAAALVRASLATWDDKPVDRAGGEDETLWNQMGARLRNLVMAAYAKVNTAGEDDTSDFLGTHQARV